MDDPEDTESLRADYDLDAWAPPPVRDVTAAVIARMSEPTARGAAATLIEHGPSRSRRRWALAGIGFTATAVGALVTYLVMRGGGPASGEGSVAAAAPSRLDLGASSAQLEANTDVVWRREGRALHVEQPRGTAMWTVGPDETIDIKSGAVGIRASGASLRVEVGMNLSDAKIIGASAVAASAVAAVTIVVYEGKAQVTSAGETVEVAAGGSIVARADRKPSPQDRDDSMSADVADRRKLQEAIDELGARLAKACSNGMEKQPTDARFVIDIDASGSAVVNQTVYFEKGWPMAADICLRENAQEARFPETRLGGRFTVKVHLTRPCTEEEMKQAAEKADRAFHHEWAAQYRLAAEVCSRRTKTCDHDALATQGEALISRGDFAEALVSLEAALACKPEPTTIARAYLAACNAKDKDKAVAMYARLAPEQQLRYVQICIRNGLEMPATVAASAKGDQDLSDARAYLADKKWQDAIDAAMRAKAAGAPGADDIIKKAGQSETASIAKLKLEDALKAGDFLAAARELAITKDTVYWQPSLELYDRVAGDKIRELAVEANVRAAADATCARYNTYLASLGGKYPPPMLAKVRSTSVCKVAIEADAMGSGSAAPTKPKNPDCAAAKLADLKAKLDNTLSMGSFREALTLADKILACGPDASTVGRGFMAACNLRDVTAAKRYYKLLSPQLQPRYAQICVRNGITL